MRSLEEQARERLEKLRRKKSPLTAFALKSAMYFSLFGAIAFGAQYAWTQTDAPVHAQTALEEGKRLITEAGLNVREVTVAGRVRTDPDLVTAAIGLVPGQSIIDFNTQAARERLELLNWVLTAKVTRTLPDQIHVELVERTPVALWQHEEGHILIDADGRLLQEHGLREFSYLPVVVGDEAPENVANLLDVIAEVPDLGARVTGAQFIAGRRWTVKLDTGLFVRLPAQNPHAAWRRFASLSEDHRLLEREVVIVDLRREDRTYVRLTPGAAERRRTIHAKFEPDTEA